VITLLVEPGRLAAEEMVVAGEAYRHLFRARRLEVGERLRVVDGRGRARWGEVTRVDRKAAAVALAGPAPDNEPAFQLALLVATLRPERASWLVEKATEVGVAAVHFLNTARAPRTFGAGALERLRRVAAAAVEQCHRSRLPEIDGPHRTADLDRLTAGRAGRWLLDTAAPTAGWGEIEESGALLVGPEGGWDEPERRDLLAAGWRPVGLGPRTLRAETAAVVGASLLLLGAFDETTKSPGVDSIAEE
jgi:16S rRNA (uracil1498-N3)-methyltransferase